MKKFLIILSFLAVFSACKKDKIYPRDRKNDCKDCVIETFENNIKVSTLTFEQYSTSTNMSWCERIDESLGKGKFFGNNGVQIEYKLNCSR